MLVQVHDKLIQTDLIFRIDEIKSHSSTSYTHPDSKEGFPFTSHMFEIHFLNDKTIRIDIDNFKFPNSFNYNIFYYKFELAKKIASENLIKLTDIREALINFINENKGDIPKFIADFEVLKF